MNKLVNVRIDEDLKKQAQEAAKQEHRSLSSYIKNLIAQDVQKKKGEKWNCGTRQTNISRS